LQLRLKVTTIYVTHDQVEAMTLADRIAVMNYGKVFQVGKPLELYNNPKNMFVASFIGSPGMNFMQARVESSDPKVRIGDYVLNLSGLPEVGGLREYVGRDVVFGVRPEDVLLVDDGSYDMEAEVIVSEPLGSETIVTLKLSDNIVKSRTHGSKLYSIGSKVRIKFVRERIKFFDVNTGELI
ncbi:MAG: TOBE domain-containing protein, partial [Zestosphaera sp.]